MKFELGRPILFGLALHMFLLSGAQGQIQITSPATGSVVNPGQVIPVLVSADATVQDVGIMTEHPLGEVQPAASSSQFSLTVPATITPGSYSLTAVGAINGNLVESVPVTLDVERSDNPVQIRIEPTIIHFRRAGQRIPLRVVGTFSDGSQIDLTGSSRTSYSSNDTVVATVSPSGIVVSGTAGSTSITAHAGSIDFSIPVRVPQPPSANISAASGSGQSAIEGQTFSQPLIAVVTDSNGVAIPGVPVAFSGPALGAGVVFANGNTSTSDSTGQAHVTVVANNAQGNNYLVSATVAGSISPAIFVLSNQLPPPDFQISPKAHGLSLKPGQSGSVPLNIVPSGGLQGLMSFSCSGLPQLSNCQFQPNTVTLDGTDAPQSVTVTITTSAPGSGTLFPSVSAGGNTGRGVWLATAIPIGVMLLLFATLVCMPKKRRTLQPMRFRDSVRHTFLSPEEQKRKLLYGRLAVATLSGALLCSVLSCGGAPSSPKPAQPGTPTGTFTVIISANSNGVAHTTALTLTIQ